MFGACCALRLVNNNTILFCKRGERDLIRGHDADMRWCRFGVDIEALPNENRLKGLEAFKRGSLRNQPDTPEEFREK